MSASALAGRIGRALAVLLAVSFLTFVVGRMSGDPVLLMARADASAEQKAALRHELGLDRRWSRSTSAMSPPPPTATSASPTASE